MSNLLDLLLRPELPDVVKDLPEKQVEVERLCGYRRRTISEVKNA